MEYSINIKPDSEGYTGCECPVCDKYFKIKYDTGILDASDCHCPYCNHIGPHKTFRTIQQIEYAQSVVLKKVKKQVQSQLKKMEHRPDPTGFIPISITVKNTPIPISYYNEIGLEEQVKCVLCGLEYTTYGVFGFCPDCGSHNSLQILNTNFDVILKMLDQAALNGADVRTQMIENALNNVVSCFDGFGRALCSGLLQKISFQNIESAKNELLQKTGFDLTTTISFEDWKFVREQFQKRHLLAHKMGVVDAEYISKTGAADSLIGRKVQISENDVRRLASLLAQMGKMLYKNIARD